MKLKLVNGIVYNICDHISSQPFLSIDLSKNSIPYGNEWIIDLKKQRVFDKNMLREKLSFEKDTYKWFEKEIKKAKIPLDKIQEAKLVIKFGFKEYDNFKEIERNLVSCTIIIEKHKFYYERYFSLF